MVHFWTLLFWYDFSLNDLKCVSTNPLQFLCSLNQLRKRYGIALIINLISIVALVQINNLQHSFLYFSYS